MSHIGIELKGSASTDVGRHRANNEDAFLFAQDKGMFAVADGMGGHNAGEVASQAAIGGLVEAADQVPDERFLLEGSLEGRQAILSWLAQTVREINLRIYTRSQQEQGLMGMGCTVDVALFRSNGVFLAHVGDSRCYLLREGTLYQVTEDHTFGNLLLKRGGQTAEQVAANPHREKLTRALGPFPDIEVDTAFFEVGPGDVFLLCSDGLHGEVPDARIQELLGSVHPSQAPQTLVEAALAAGGRDNVTPVVVGVDRCAVSRPIIIGSQLSRLAMANADLFAGFTETELLTMLKIAHGRTFAPGANLFQQGRRTDALVLPLEGSISLWRDDQLIGRGGPGDHFGDMVLLDEPSPITVRADSIVTVLEFGVGPLRELLASNSPVAARLTFSLYKRLSARATGVLDSLARYRRAYGPTPP